MPKKFQELLAHADGGENEERAQIGLPPKADLPNASLCGFILDVGLIFSKTFVLFIFSFVHLGSVGVSSTPFEYAFAVYLIFFPVFIQGNSLNSTKPTQLLLALTTHIE